jgi:hypothetical protein
MLEMSLHQESFVVPSTFKSSFKHQNGSHDIAATKQKELYCVIQLVNTSWVLHHCFSITIDRALDLSLANKPRESWFKKQIKSSL